jgi:hypothetical protein
MYEVGKVPTSSCHALYEALPTAVLVVPIPTLIAAAITVPVVNVIDTFPVLSIEETLADSVPVASVKPPINTIVVLPEVT